MLVYCRETAALLTSLAALMQDSFSLTLRSSSSCLHSVKSQFASNVVKV